MALLVAFLALLVAASVATIAAALRGEQVEREPQEVLILARHRH